MSRPHPHPLALFSLIPYDDNKRAKAVVAHPCNSHLISTTTDGELALDIGFHIRSKSHNTLATLGRGDTDIFVDGASIAKIQCSFEIDLDTNVVMLYDRSYYRTTQVYGENAMPFEHERLPQVVVQANLNTVVGMGGEGRNLVQFELIWHQDPDGTIEKVKNREDIVRGYEEHPRIARTIMDETDTVFPSRRETRIHTPGTRQLKMRYMTIGDMLGAGQFGEVYKAVNVDSGKLMAVKMLKLPDDATKKQRDHWRESVYYALKREVENLAKINHPHIVDYIASQGWDGPKVEIFMGLKEGTLESLIESGSNVLPDIVFRQMLGALDCLDFNGIVHRDVKPENILYITRPDGEHQFQLGDFGQSNRTVDAHTLVGTPLYGAPEMLRGKQTHKVDVWSLFVTMLWVLDVRRFRQKSTQFRTTDEVREFVVVASKEQTMSQIREMAILDPEKRASAAQMLVKCFNGEGLSTPRNQIPALIASPTTIVTKDAAPTPPTPRTRTAPKRPSGLQKNVAAAAQHRVDKARISQAQPLLEAFQPRIPGAFPSDKGTAEKRKWSQKLITDCATPKKTTEQ